MISVVLSVYNTGKYLPVAFVSLLKQTYMDYEIIIVDDGSDEEDAGLCDRMAQGHENVRVFHKENGGLSSARNCGIRHAHGDYITFPDPDDWVEPDYLKILLEGYENADVSLSICGFFITRNGEDMSNDRGMQKTVLDTETALDYLMHPSIYCGFAWNKLYKMSIIREHGLLFDEELLMIQDLEFAVRYISLGGKVVFNPVPLYHYNRDSGGVTQFRKKLGVREMSGYKTYEKIGRMTGDTYPRVAAAAYASLCEMTLWFMDTYYRTGMDEPEMLKTMRKYLRRYRRYFFASERFTLKHKCAGALSVLSPKLYLFLIRTFGHKSRFKNQKRLNGR